jgi:hypothetical protein
MKGLVSIMLKTVTKKIKVEKTGLGQFTMEEMSKLKEFITTIENFRNTFAEMSNQSSNIEGLEIGEPSLNIFDIIYNEIELGDKKIPGLVKLLKDAHDDEMTSSRYDESGEEIEIEIEDGDLYSQPQAYPNFQNS